MADQAPTFRRYVALGDSFTEGVGDPDPSRPNGLRGWADQVADELEARTPGFAYANLAVRGRLMRQILDEQVEPAAALQPDLVTIYAGGNDLMRPKVDIDGLVDAYDAAIDRLTGTGATVCLWTAFDAWTFPVFRHMRGRSAIYNELVREVAERHGARIVDFWRLREFRDPRMWDVDRLHLSAAGHHRMATAVLDVLGIEHDRTEPELPERPVLDARQRRQAHRDWARTYAVPWVGRRLTGRSSGDGVLPKHPQWRRS